MRLSCRRPRGEEVEKQRNKTIFLKNKNYDFMAPNILGPLISGSSNIVDTGVNALLQNATNKRNQRYATYMYDRQRADALSDWQMQNAYNSPAAQMQRFKDAGLNPNLIYGQTSTAPAVRSSAAPSFKAEAPQLNMGSAMSAFYDTRMKNTQMDVARSVIETNEERKRQIAADTMLKIANTGYVTTKAGQATLKLALDTALNNIYKDQADWNLRKTQSEVTKNYSQVGVMEAQRILTTDENGRRERLTEANINQKLVQMALAEAQTQLAKSNIQLTDAKRGEVAQQVLNAIKTREGMGYRNALLKSELDYQTIERTQSWLKTIIGAARK